MPRSMPAIRQRKVTAGPASAAPARRERLPLMAAGLAEQAARASVENRVLARVRVRAVAPRARAALGRLLAQGLAERASVA